MSVIAELNTVREKRGTLNPQVVLEEARDPQHPLHNRFDWDDTVAAEKWRLEQAGQLLRVTYRPDPKTPVDLRAFLVRKGEETPESEYIPTGEAFADPFTRELTLRRMDREWKAFKLRYAHHKEFADFIRREVEGLGEAS